MTLALCACNLFTLPFALNNPQDPKNAWKYKLVPATRYLSDHRGAGVFNDIAVSHDGSFLLATDWQDGVCKIQTGSGAVTRYGGGAGTYYQSICISPAGDAAYCISASQTVNKLDLGTGRFSQVYQAASGQGLVDIAIDNSNILYALGNSPVSVIKMDTSGNVQATITNSNLGFVPSIAVSDSSLFCASSGSNTGVFLLDKTSGNLQSEIYHAGGSWQNNATVTNGDTGITGKIAYNASQGRLYAAFWDGNPVAVFDPALPSPYVSSLGASVEFSESWWARVTADDSGKIYVSDRFLGFIKELTTATTVYTSPARNPGEFGNITDMAAANDNTIYVVDNVLWEMSYLASDGSFHIFGTPGKGVGQLFWPGSLAAMGSDVYVGCGGPASKVMHYGARGVFISEASVASEGTPRRMTALPDGRLLVWTGGQSLHAYTTAPWGLSGNTTISDANAATAMDLFLCVSTDGKIYCAYYGLAHASLGILSSDLATYTEIWSSASDPVFSRPQLNGQYRIAGIAPAPAGDVWVAFAGPGAIVRFNAKGGVFASFAVRNNYEGPAWTAGQIVAYSLDKNGNWMGPWANVMTADPIQTVYVSYDGPDIAKYSPEMALQ